MAAKLPWIQVEERLPELAESDLGDWCQESVQVLIRTRPVLTARQSLPREHFVAYLRQPMEDGEPDSNSPLHWVLVGQDGYTLECEKVEAWLPLDQSIS